MRCDLENLQTAKRPQEVSRDSFFSGCLVTLIVVPLCASLVLPIFHVMVVALCKDVL